MKKFLAAFVLASVAAFAAADSVYFVSDTNNHDLYRMDPGTLAITLVGSLGIDGSNNTFGDLAYDTANSTMYYSGGRGDQNLYRVNLTTGAATLVGAHNQADMFALGYDSANNTLYGALSNGNFGSVNTSTGAFTLIGATGVYDEGLTYNSGTSQMILSDPTIIYSLNVGTGAATNIGAISGNNDNGIAYDSVRNVYWIYNYNGQIFEENATNFTTTNTLTPGDGNGTSIAYVPTSAPEPATVALIGLGALGLIRRRTRR